MAAIISTSLKFIDRAHSHEVSIYFLLQSYIASVISFAGMYLVSYLYEPYSAFVLFTWHEESNKCHFAIYQVIARLLYFSMSTMTSTGFGTLYASCHSSFVCHSSLTASFHAYE
jgi:drug/metabolite transporter superfamily protein YnfA